MIYLSYTELVYVAERAMGETPVVRDAGLLEAAAARLRTTVFGEDAYPVLEDKAAAMVQSIARNHALVDGNKRLTLGALIAFLGVGIGAASRAELTGVRVAPDGRRLSGERCQAT